MIWLVVVFWTSINGIDYAHIPVSSMGECGVWRDIVNTRQIPVPENSRAICINLDNTSR